MTIRLIRRKNPLTPMGLFNRIGAALSSDADPAVLRQEISRLEQELSARSQVAQTSELLQAVVDAAPAAIVLLDEIGKVAAEGVEASDLAGAFV